MPNSTTSLSSIAPDASAILERLGQLRAELVDLAYTLERRGRPDAADVAISVSAHVGAVCDEITASRSDQTSG